MSRCAIAIRSSSGARSSPPSARFFSLPLPSHFVAEDRCRRRHIERFDVAVHGDGHDAIAVLENIAPDSLALTAEDQSDLPAKIDRRGGIAAFRRGVDPVAAL